jgi:hypothetical protein
MAMWRGWSAALPSRLTWNEWQELQRGRISAARPEATTPDAASNDRVAELEQFSRRLAVENAALRIALQHWQDQPVAVGAGA